MKKIGMAHDRLTPDKIPTGALCATIGLSTTNAPGDNLWVSAAMIYPAISERQL